MGLKSTLKWPSLEDRRRFQRICLCRRILDGSSIIEPSFFQVHPRPSSSHKNSIPLCKDESPSFVLQACCCRRPRCLTRSRHSPPAPPSRTRLGNYFMHNSVFPSLSLFFSFLYFFVCHSPLPQESLYSSFQLVGLFLLCLQRNCLEKLQ